MYVPALGSDAIFVFDFDAKTGRLTSATPAVALMKAMTGPRHFVTSPDNKFLYVLSEFLATVTTYAIDGKTGQLTEVSSATGLPPDSKLVAGAPRGSIAGRNMDNDIWAADIQMTPNGKFLYISERTSSTIGAFSVDARDRQAHVSFEHADREAAARIRDRSQRDAISSPPARSRRRRRCTRSTPAAAR